MSEKITSDKVMYYGHIDIFPRYIGIPYQKIIFNKTHFKSIVKVNNKKVPIYTSQNAYNRFQNNKPVEIIIDKMLFDIDTDFINDYNIILNDVKKLSVFFTEINIPHQINFSGDGFHLYPIFKPKKYNYGSKIQYISNLIGRMIKEKINLKSLNPKCSEIKHLMRIPYTGHVPLDGMFDGKYDIFINNGIFENEYIDIVNLSRHKSFKYAKRIESDITFKNFVNILIDNNILEKEQLKNNFNVPSSGNMTLKIRHDTLFSDLYNLLPTYPCLVNAIFNENPSHMVRVNFAIVMKNLKLLETEEEAQKFFDEFATKYWIDGNNYERRHKQVASLYNGNFNYLPSCNKLESICIGKKCKRFRSKKV